MKKEKVVLKLWQEVKVKVNIVISDDIKIYYTVKFLDFTARYIINISNHVMHPILQPVDETALHLAIAQEDGTSLPIVDFIVQNSAT